ncbi:hypothetical protein A3B21_04690 [Candidatus Uhrbacteria bacterium RIFCSPLOWO2_01_FULL_47_24]|uniref:Glycosyltransferase subfamily 4-like N-terminal domain-containing protein n=1 Tax=Candidatus Uhrbacteria bacterium RIFCSPLOWO2_01_FULL_47_24 TaxID=1802401 RepID=A0A1F7UTY2_9BACT|nr:MAG: hypothetical protein A2753_01950 [Candidatus Uhrbacteria bacterium RIFCSPHIGHO2_01_FULL_47_11]OGL75922.1 MAG: hypothetical protein A3F52_02575 [Candidatus Uhrbacteria bacterium RIFCSPHIGHO2_12_FULL_47_11]OGL81716.1 MAG: hypothetical protein A3B21_04690 [Candidatus Uhrbacteria bacterium RIFCSPLOWO2_01_FULL_47_24]OGL85031.1 MAG: hypothetical protein A3J03_03630 [Candidatus Uhrbacteria bacterium RIFCSPLOWO2_02_FULL_46_25]OGL91737.1 MAG: hypothetical protein A3H11_01190 [Candidatus Uhrbacte
MQILIITQRWYPDTFGGSEHVAAQQARRLAQRGHQVVVITERAREVLPSYEVVRNPSQPPLTLRGGDQLEPPLRVRGGEGELRIYRYGSSAQFARFGGLSRTDLKEVPKILKGLSPKHSQGLALFDVAILHHPFPAQGFFKANLKIPALYLFHASTASEAEVEGIKKFPISSGQTESPRHSRDNFQFPIFSSLLARAFSLWAYRVERNVLTKSDRIAVLSDFSAQTVKEYYPEAAKKITRIPIGIDTEQFKPADQKRAREKLGFAQDRKIILTVRRFTPRMGVSRLIHAMEDVLERMPDAQLLIVGEGPLKAALQAEIQLRRLQSKVTLVGAVPISDLPLYYQAADLFVLPTVAFEGLGMATLEALACGIPVVGTPVGATSEVLGALDPALITRGKDADAIAQGILDFFARPLDERAKLRKKAREIAEKNYNWERAIDELEEVIKTLKH